METFARVSHDAPGNPSSVHRAGRHAQAALEQAREEVAAILKTSARNILFTSGATEANNLAILGLAHAFHRVTGERIPLFASKAEHPAALAPLRLLQQEGFPLHLVEVGAHASLDTSAFLKAREASTASFTVVQWANNETGAVQDIATLAAATDQDHLWHCDAVQGFGKLPLDSSLWRATTLSLSGHKFGAPKGVGVLRLQDDAMLDPIQVGGGQQRSLRSGTESPALAAAFAHALSLAVDEQESKARLWLETKQAFLSQWAQMGIDSKWNHPQDDRCLPNTLNLHFPGIDGRLLVPACDADGLEISAGSACSSGAALPSPVLVASGLAPEEARASIRISFGPNSTPESAKEAANRLGQVAARLYEVAKR